MSYNEYKNGLWANRFCPNPTQVWEDITYGVHQFVKQLTFYFANGTRLKIFPRSGRYFENTQPNNSNLKFFSQNRLNDTHSLWTTRDDKLKRCYTLTIPRKWITSGLKRMIFTFIDTVGIYFHTPGVYLTSYDKVFYSLDSTSFARKVICF